MRVTFCAAKLVSDNMCPSLITVSVYDTKPIHFLTMEAEKIKWEEKTQNVNDKGKGNWVKMKLLRININDDYTYGMGGADVDDHILGSYRHNHWMHNFKWWHSIFWWGVQVLMVNYLQVLKQI